MDFSQLQPTDPRLNWGHVKLEILQKVWQKGITGKGIRVGILDSGDLPTHPDLVFDPENLNDLAAAPSATPAHGAFCTGVIGAAGGQVFGVAPEATLAYAKVPVKTAKVAQGIEWLLALRPSVHVISISLELFKSTDIAAPEAFKLLEDAVNKALKRGKIIVAPVGNEFSNGADIEDRYPAAFPGVLAIGALREDMTLHIESGINACIGLVAPGDKLRTAQQGGGVFAGFGKTSAATAFASGAVALVLHAIKKKRKSVKTINPVGLLKETAIFNFQGEVKCASKRFGCGLINPAAAVEKILAL
jgi:subtilisin family serine protease